MANIDFNKRRSNTIFFDPTPVAGLRLWYDASDASTVTLNGSRVSGWDDKSGSGDHLTQASTSIQPLYVLAAQNGLNGILFNSTRDDKLARSLGNINQPHTVFIVSSATGSGNRFMLKGLSSLYHFYKSSAVGNRIVVTAGSPAKTGATIFGAAMTLHTMIFNGAGSALYLNRDVNTLSGNPGTGGIVTGLEVGASSTSNGWSGYINEIRLYNSVLSAANIEKTWDQMIDHKWGI